jgi:hypothetical protein
MTRELTRRELYWIGYRAGKRTAEHEQHVTHLPSLKLAVLLAGRGPSRPFAVGELRGYRLHAGIPE